MERTGNIRAQHTQEQGRKETRPFTPQLQELFWHISRLAQVSGFLRINFLSAQLNLSLEEAERSLQSLQQMGLVKLDKFGHVTLTEQGASFAQSMKKEKIYGNATGMR